MHDILQEPTNTDMLFEPEVGFLLYVMFSSERTRRQSHETKFRSMGSIDHCIVLMKTSSVGCGVHEI